MLAQKTFHDGSTEIWVWDGLALIRRGSDIYVNEPHVSGGISFLKIVSLTSCKISIICDLSILFSLYSGFEFKLQLQFLHNLQ